MILPDYVHALTFFKPLTSTISKFDKRWEYMKPTKWRSEREWRVVTSDKKSNGALHSFVPFHGNVLESLTFGSETVPSDIEDLSKIARQVNSNVRLFRMRPVPDLDQMESVPLT
jgi:hypothetical protein